MTPEDRKVASVMFRLVCFKHSFGHLSVQALTLAVDMVLGKKVRHDKILDRQTVKGLRRRIMARSGGLLEIVHLSKGRGDESWFRDLGDSDVDGDVDGDVDSGEGSDMYLTDTSDKDFAYFAYRHQDVRLAHKTVKSYLERRKWLQESVTEDIDSGTHTLWLDICCAYLERVSRALETKFSVNDIDTDRTFKHLSERFWLLPYAVNYVFRHASELEWVYKISTFDSIMGFIDSGCLHSLQFQVPWALWPHVREMDAHRKWPMQAQTGCHGQVWSLMVQERLLLCYKDAVNAGRHSPQAGDIDAAFANWNMYWGNEEIEELALFMVKHVASFTDQNILDCLHTGCVTPLKAMLEVHPRGYLQWKRRPVTCYSGCLFHDIVAGSNARRMIGPLQALAMGHSTVNRFEEVLDLLLVRGENLNEVCEPYGAMIQADVRNYGTYHDDDRVEKLTVILRHGANINLIGPSGTPLQQAWDQRFRGRYHEKHRQLRQIFKILIDYGATLGWQAADGTVPTKEEILAWRSEYDESDSSEYEEEGYDEEDDSKEDDHEQDEDES
ncbi:MAG: hypothetical protein M1835_002252 [Candelina submexicana]|nr:MAG: hypothetical protein M1835_002252 [Candelina submexicana]